jgi:acetyl esterase/lipase
MAKIFSTLLVLLLLNKSFAQYPEPSETHYGVQNNNSHKMEKTSFKSKIYRASIRITGIKKIIEKEFQSHDFSSNNKAAAIPDKVQRQCDVLHRKSATGRAIWELRKKDTETQRYILYLHGGAFVHNITKYDWELLNRIVQYTGYGIVVPDYPLAPEHNYKDVYSMMAPVYQELLQRVGSESVVLMGFSAGGGLALSLAQYAKEKLQEQPSHIILLSPLLDGRLLNPEIVGIDKHDPYLDIESLRKALLAYSGGDDIGNYMISPINGSVEGLAPIHLFIGTHEILLPDARQLVVLAKKKNVHIDYYEYPKMYHAWIFLNMPEAKNVFIKLVNILH